jgi:hypothetical protein
LADAPTDADNSARLSEPRYFGMMSGSPPGVPGGGMTGMTPCPVGVPKFRDRFRRADKVVGSSAGVGLVLNVVDIFANPQAINFLREPGGPFLPEFNFAPGTGCQLQWGVSATVWPQEPSGIVEEDAVRRARRSRRSLKPVILFSRRRSPVLVKEKRSPHSCR